MRGGSLALGRQPSAAFGLIAANAGLYRSQLRLCIVKCAKLYARLRTVREACAPANARRKTRFGGSIVNKQRRKAKDIDPFVSTSDFLDMSGVTQMTLRTYEKQGLITPAYRSEPDMYKYYNLDQIPLARIVDAMRAAGASLSEIQEASQLSKPDFLNSAYYAQASALRRDRRMMKSIVHTQRRLSDALGAMGLAGDGYYLRYMPLRWMAIIPLAPHEAKFSPSRLFIERFQDLMRVVHVVGWSTTMAFGTLISASSDSREAERYAYIELASPPMPVTTGSMVVDGGCYHCIDETFNAQECSGVSCEACSRFGRRPTEEELSRWGAFDDDSASDEVYMADDIEKPVAGGTWEGYERLVLAARSDSSIDVSAEANNTEAVAGAPMGEEGDDEPAPIPVRMPCSVRLPMGVTACSLPAGVHLCRRILFSDDAAKQDFIDVVEKLSPSKRTPQEVAQRCGAAGNSEWGAPHNKGPFVEPFAVPRAHGSMELAGWSSPISGGDLSHISLVSPAGLGTKGDFCMTSSNIPMSYDENVFQEYHVLVDPGDLLPNL